jgi:gamma-butyrobetaine dioxygenase
VMIEYYRAFRKFMAATRDPAERISFKLKPGEMVVFDNRRILHGREAFNPATGHRLLRGFYIDRGEIDSRIRTLSRQA